MDDKCFEQEVTVTVSGLHYPASYHNGAARVSFADGQVETRRWLEGTTTVGLGKARPGSRTSATDRDVKWLQEHCTYETEGR